MRIAIDARYVQDHFPGIARYTFNLVRALAGLGSDVGWVVIHNPAQKNSRYDVASLARLPGVELQVSSVPTFSLAEQIQLPRLARRLSVDLWHSPYYVMPYRLGIPVVLTFYDAIAHHFPDTLAAPWKRPPVELLTRMAVRTAQRFVAISAVAAEDLERFYGVAPSRVSVTPLGVDEHFVPQDPSVVAEAASRYGLERPYVLYLASNKPHKNLPRLLQAWHIARGEGRLASFRLVVAGHWDPRFPEAREMAERLGLGESVHFAGPVAEADLPAVYSGADLFVFPSLYEGFGLPVLEAMACGTPVVCSNTSSLPEVAGDAALTVDPLDVSALAAAIRNVLSDAGLRDELRRRGLVRAASFSWTRTGQQTLEVYRQVMTDL